MSYGDAADAGRSGQKESVVALASRFLTGKSKVGNEVATLSPLVIDFNHIETICLNSKLGICQVNVGTETVAEIVMAGVDERPVLFQEGQTGRAPVGICLVDEPPPSGGRQR